jgi:hypothetical protein
MISSYTKFVTAPTHHQYSEFYELRVLTTTIESFSFFSFKLAATALSSQPSPQLLLSQVHHYRWLTITLPSAYLGWTPKLF